MPILQMGKRAQSHCSYWPEVGGGKEIPTQVCELSSLVLTIMLGQGGAAFLVSQKGSKVVSLNFQSFSLDAAGTGSQGCVCVCVHACLCIGGFSPPPTSRPPSLGPAGADVTSATCRKGHTAS